MVLGELDGGALSSSATELLAAGSVLSREMDVPLALGIAGVDTAAAAQTGAEYGAATIYTVDNPLLTDDAAELTLEAWAGICRQTEPSVILISRTTLGRDLAPRLAGRLRVGLAQDCLEARYDADADRVVALRPVYGGNAMAAVVCRSNPQIVCIRPKAYEPLERNAAAQATIEPLQAPLEPSMRRVRLVQRVQEEQAGVKLETARVVVAGGRGLGAEEPFRRLEELAGLLDGGVGASRAAVDAGWAPPAWQIGLTGKSISPDLYITVAISGASQHMAGCSGAKVVVAVNKDANANIFKEARYGVVGDWEKTLPSFTETVRELLG